MIGYLKGRVLEVDSRSIIIETGGVGYLVFVTSQTNRKLVKNGVAELLVHTAVKDDAIDLFGFETLEERTLFADLLLVSGVGPRSALSILSIASPEELESAIASKDVGYLTKVSGIGRKTAEKIMVELADKFLIRGTKTNGNGERLYENDVIEGLQALGYTLNEARNALQSIDPKITDTGEKIKAALKIIGRK